MTTEYWYLLFSLFVCLLVFVCYIYLYIYIYFPGTLYVQNRYKHFQITGQLWR